MNAIERLQILKVLGFVGIIIYTLTILYYVKECWCCKDKVKNVENYTIMLISLFGFVMSILSFFTLKYLFEIWGI